MSGEPAPGAVPDRFMPSTHPITRVACAVILGSAAVSPIAQAGISGILFADDFRYAVGDLAGNAGGTGWTGAWSGGTGATGNQVASALAPGDLTARSVRISSDANATSRSLSATYTSGTSSYYVSFVLNASPFSVGVSGDYAGVALYDDSVAGNRLFLGMPGASGQLGFDWYGHSVETSAAASATNYLVLCAITPGALSGTSVQMHATTNLSMTGSALAATTPIAQVLNDPGFSFNAVEMAGGYDIGTINIAGLAMASNPDDAVSFTQNAVPGPGAMLVAALAARWRAGSPSGAGSRRRPA